MLNGGITELPKCGKSEKATLGREGCIYILNEAQYVPENISFLSIYLFNPEIVV